MKYNSNDTVLVSVPLRGFCFSTAIIEELIDRIEVDGFRPLTGILFFNARQSTRRLRVMRGVSVPLRGFCFSTRKSSKRQRSQARRFRPLTGILFFNQFYEQAGTLHIIPGFPSPLRGFCFSTKGKKSAYGLASLRFRPLTGILFFNAGSVDSAIKYVEEFPSPYGDFVFQRKERKAHTASQACVSVPLRGFCFSTARWDWMRGWEERRSFRPLTGILFFNIPPVKTVGYREYKMFPSPYGDFVFQQVTKERNGYHED